MRIAAGRTPSAPASACSPTAPRRSPMPSSVRRAAHRRGGPRALEVARDLLAHFGGVGPLLARDASTHPPRRASARRGRRSSGGGRARPPLALRKQARRATCLPRPRRCGTTCALTLSALPYEAFVGPLPRQPEPPHRRGGAVPRHAVADQRLSARGGQGGAGAQRRRRHLRPQSPVRRRRAVPGRRAADESLKQALALVDIRTLDHFVVAGPRVVSFAERGLL